MRNQHLSACAVLGLLVMACDARTAEPRAIVERAVKAYGGEKKLAQLQAVRSADPSGPARPRHSRVGMSGRTGKERPENSQRSQAVLPAEVMGIVLNNSSAEWRDTNSLALTNSGCHGMSPPPTPCRWGDDWRPAASPAKPDLRPYVLFAAPPAAVELQTGFGGGGRGGQQHDTRSHL